MNSGNINRLKEIFMSFFKVGLFTFGGGYAMIPLIEKEMVESRKWISKEEITDIFAVSQSIPGAIAINSATFIGFKISGRKGALAATMGVIMPSFIVISIIAAFFSTFDDNIIVQSAFAGIRPTIVALIMLAAFKIGKASIRDRIGILVTILGVILVIVLNIHAIIVIVAGAVFGLSVYMFWPNKVRKIVEKEE